MRDLWNAKKSRHKASAAADQLRRTIQSNVKTPLPVPAHTVIPGLPAGKAALGLASAYEVPAELTLVGDQPGNVFQLLLPPCNLPRCGPARSVDCATDVRYLLQMPADHYLVMLRLPYARFDQDPHRATWKLAAHRGLGVCLG